MNPPTAPEHVTPTSSGQANTPLVTVPDESWRAALTRDDVDVRVWDVDSDPGLTADELARVRLVVLPYLGPYRAVGEVATMPNLVAVQGLTAGFEEIVERVPAGVPVCNAAGVHSASTAEIALALVLAGQRGLPEAVLDQVGGRWDPQMRPSLADRAVLVVGVGGVGMAIAHRLEPFEVRLTRVGTRARADEWSARFGDVRGIDELPDLLPQHEIVIVGVPLNDATRDLFDAAMLARMPDGALLVNVGRGAVVNTDALTRDVLAGRLRAAVDVIDPEPFPGDHPLRTAPGFLLTPHLGGDSSAFVPRATAMLRDQLDRVAGGAPLAHLVHP